MQFAVPVATSCATNIFLSSGLAWHTEEATLRQKFEEFGAVEEAVSREFARLLFIIALLGVDALFASLVGTGSQLASAHYAVATFSHFLHAIR